MQRREQVEREHRSREAEQDEPQAPAIRAESESLKHDLDDILDDIDAVLEENAEEFVKAYVQKGGE